MLDVLKMFKIGVGPSSSHTVGPMRIGLDFADRLIEEGRQVRALKVVLHGSLSSTGVGHMTDSAVILGLMGEDPATVDVEAMPGMIGAIRRDHLLLLKGASEPISFDWQRDMIFDDEMMPLHENGLVITAECADGTVTGEYYSTGGGFYCRAEDFADQRDEDDGSESVPYPYASAAEMIDIAEIEGISLSTLARRNQDALLGDGGTYAKVSDIWRVMRESIERGIETEGILPGPLRLTRRAVGIWRRLKSSRGFDNDPMSIIDWVNLFAIAVCEENAAGGRVVTAPTNGACGVVPAVLAYFDKFVAEVDLDICARYLLVCGMIGAIYKSKASISGAEVGCQGEVGVACSMSAAGLAELMGGSPRQVCSAAEIAMEHCLGLTCDPVAGLVQVPCIERNAVMAVKAINSARMALMRTTAPRVSLDDVVRTMFETGKDMSAKYRETSGGGLAKSVICMQG